MVIRRKFHTESPKILEFVLRNLVAMVTWRPGFVQTSEHDALNVVECRVTSAQLYKDIGMLYDIFVSRTRDISVSSVFIRLVTHTEGGM